MMMPTFRTQLIAEFFGTATLLVIIVGSGIVVSQDGSEGIAALFPHAVTIGVGLGVLILLLRPVSGAQFNPAVTLCALALRLITLRHAVAYITVQTAGAIVGVVATDRLMGGAAFAFATTERTGMSLLVSETAATTWLLVIIFVLVRRGELHLLPSAVGGYILAAILFTPSTAFANPAVTIARVFTESYTGIAVSGVPGFVVAQLVAIPVALRLITMFHPSPTSVTGDDKR